MAVSGVSASVYASIQQSSASMLRRGARGQAVVDLQKALEAAGFSPGPADGDFGPRTESAVLAFQRANGLVIDGTVGPQTWGVLKRAVAPQTSAAAASDSPSALPAVTLRRGSNGAAVRQLQTTLETVGFNPGPVDGDFGPRTDAAVRSFQRASGLYVDGVVGPQTRAALTRALAEGDQLETPPPSSTPVPAPGGSGVGATDDFTFTIPNAVLRVGARGPTVRLLQLALQSHGFSPGPVDGDFGPRTRTAVTAFQRACGLTVDGVVGPQTWTALARTAPAEAVTPIDDPPPAGSLPVLTRNLRYIRGQIRSGNDVRSLQQRLHQLGVYPHAVDGQFGPATRAAVVSFQQAHGLPPTGVVGITTWRALGGPHQSGLGAVYPSAPVPLAPLSSGEMRTFTTQKRTRRSSGAAVRGIVLHHTASPHGSAQVVAETVCGTSPRQVSVQFVVGEDGEIWAALPSEGTPLMVSLEDYTYWHAGIDSSFTAPNGVTYTNGNVNRNTIGIEIVNRGDGSEVYPQAQMIAVARLVRFIQEAFDVPMSGVTTHRDVAPTRKIDPSDNFPYEALLLAAQSGVWDPHGNTEELAAVA